MKLSIKKYPGLTYDVFNNKDPIHKFMYEDKMYYVTLYQQKMFFDMLERADSYKGECEAFMGDEWVEFRPGYLSLLRKALAFLREADMSCRNRKSFFDFC